MTGEQWLWNPSSLLSLLSIAVAATLACAVGLTAARSVKSAVLQHAILLASLVLMLLSPLMVGVATTSRLSWVTVNLKKESSQQMVRPGDARVIDTGGSVNK